MSTIKTSHAPWRYSKMRYSNCKSVVQGGIWLRRTSKSTMLMSRYIVRVGDITIISHCDIWRHWTFTTEHQLLSSCVWVCWYFYMLTCGSAVWSGSGSSDLLAIGVHAPALADAVVALHWRIRSIVVTCGDELAHRWPWPEEGRRGCQGCLSVFLACSLLTHCNIHTGIKYTLYFRVL